MSSWEMMFLLKIVPTSTFRNQSELPSTMNVAVAKTVHAGQHVIVKAGIANFTKVKKDNSGRFNMVHAVLVDPSRSIKLTLWESFVSNVVAGSTYLFHNLMKYISIQHSLEQMTSKKYMYFRLLHKHQQSILPQLRAQN